MYEPDIVTDVRDYWVNDMTPASTIAPMVDAGSNLNTTWAGVQLCPSVDFRGNARVCEDGNTTNCCDIGAFEYAEEQSQPEPNPSVSGGSVSGGSIN